MKTKAGSLKRLTKLTKFQLDWQKGENTKTIKIRNERTLLPTLNKIKNDYKEICE